METFESSELRSSKKFQKSFQSILRSSAQVELVEVARGKLLVVLEILGSIVHGLLVIVVTARVAVAEHLRERMVRRQCGGLVR